MRIIRSFTSCEAPTTIEPVSVVGIIFWAAACAMRLPSASRPTRLRRGMAARVYNRAATVREQRRAATSVFRLLFLS